MGPEVKSSLLFLWHNFVDFMDKGSFTQNFDQISRSFNVTKFRIQCERRQTRECTKYFHVFFFCIFVSCMEMKPIKIYFVFDHFSRTCEVTKF